jgi:uncharacterized protein (DUF58 family)
MKRPPTAAGDGAVAAADPTPPVVLQRSTRMMTGASSGLMLLLFLLFPMLVRSGNTELLSAAAGMSIALLLVSNVWPALLLRRLSPSVAASPTDLTVGDGYAIEVMIKGRVRHLQVRDPDGGQWFRTAAPVRARIPDVAVRRGSYDRAGLEVATAGPLGMCRAVRRYSMPMPSPMLVGPRATPMAWVPRRLPSEAADTGGWSGSGGGDVVRSVRPYVPGDPAHLVHWPSTARHGVIQVRELEPPARTGEAVVVHLLAASDEAEAAAARAAGLARAVLAAGGQLLLVTVERNGPVVARARSRLDVARRLARAIPGEPPEPPDGWPTTIVRG